MSKDKISIMNGKRIVAAYSTAPFAEATDGYPDYTFFDREVTDQRGKRQTMHWCVRKGRLEIPWGTTFRNGECAANGSLYVSRRNVNEATFYGEGLPFVKERVAGAEVWYLYESEFTGEGFRGFSVYMRECLLPYIRRVAEERGVEGFRAAVETDEATECALMKMKGFAGKLEEHHLDFAEMIVHDVREKEVVKKEEE
jgi:hypothetical protein